MIDNELMYFILGIISALLIGYIFYLKSKREIKPVILYKSMLIQSSNVTDLQILFKGEKISNLYKLDIIFINEGKKPIKRDDVPVGNYPQVILQKGCRLLSYRIKSSSGAENNFKCEKIDDRTLQLNFDFMDKHDGCHIEIFHDALKEFLYKEDVVSFKAKIIGSGTPQRIRFFDAYFHRQFGFIKYSIVIIILGFCLYGLVMLLDKIIGIPIIEYYGKLYSIFKCSIALIVIVLLTLLSYHLTSDLKKIPEFAKNTFFEGDIEDIHSIK